MKLYCTATSERASKGQGGNSEIVVDLKIENPERKRIAMLKLTNNIKSYTLAILRDAGNWETIKEEMKQ